MQVTLVALLLVVCAGAFRWSERPRATGGDQGLRREQRRVPSSGAERVRNGMGIYEQAAIELPGVEGTRSLRSGDASTHPSGDTHLLVSFATLRPLERIVLLEMASTVMPATACTSEDLKNT